MIENKEYDNMLMEAMSNLVKKQKFMAIDKYGHFHNIHEFFAVLLEEYEEVLKEISGIDNYKKILWEDIKADKINDTIIGTIHHRAFNCIKELIQVMAVCDKYYMMEEKK